MAAAGGNVLCRAGAAHLPGVQRRAARAVDAVAGSGFTNSKQAFHVGLPPAVDANAAVVMLGAEGDLQRLGVQIHTLITVKIDGRLVHLRQPLNRRAEAGTRACQILPRFRQQGVKSSASAWRGPSCGEVNGSCSMSRPAMWTASTRVYHFYDAFGHVIGVEECEEGKLDTKYDILLLQPAYTKYHLELGEISSYPPGYKENAGIFCHNNPWVSCAETVVGHGDRAFEIYKKTCPAYIEDISEIHRTEPYVYSQMVAGRDAATFGEAKNSWLTGTAAWTFVDVSQYILGIQPTLAGLKIDPCIPHEMDGFTLRRVWRGATYEIVVENPDHLEKGVKAMTVDGKPVSGNILSPVPAGSTVEVKIVMG